MPSSNRARFLRGHLLCRRSRPSLSLSSCLSRKRSRSNSRLLNCHPRVLAKVPVRSARSLHHSAKRLRPMPNLQDLVNPLLRPARSLQDLAKLLAQPATSLQGSARLLLRPATNLQGLVKLLRPAASLQDLANLLAHPPTSLQDLVKLLLQPAINLPLAQISLRSSSALRHLLPALVQMHARRASLCSHRRSWTHPS